MSRKRSSRLSPDPLVLAIVVLVVVAMIAYLRFGDLMSAVPFIVLIVIVFAIWK